jgi:hypothetical protein
LTIPLLLTLCEYTSEENTPTFGERSESAVRPIDTERYRTSRAFGKSSRIDLVVLRISERLLSEMMKFQAVLEICMVSLAAFVYINRYKNRTVSVRRPTEITNRTNAFPSAMGAIRPNSAHVPTAFFCGLTDRIEPIVVSEHTLDCAFNFNM